MEHSLRQLTGALKNVIFEPDCNVRELAYANARVCGVICNLDGRDGATKMVAADFVIDTGGRGSHAPGWLRQLGFAEPPTTVLDQTSLMQAPSFGSAAMALTSGGY